MPTAQPDSSRPLARPRRAAIVVNPSSRSGEEAVGTVRDLLVRAAIPAVTLTPSSGKDARRLVSELPAEIDMVIGIGGDGTLHYLAAGLLGSPRTLAIVPSGTANDFARAIDLPEAIDDAMHVALGGVTRTFDMGLANGEPFLNVASIGLVEDITDRLSERSKAATGGVAYVIAAVEACMRAEPFRVRLDRGRGVEERECLQLSVGNGRYFGRFLTVSPDAEARDGLLDACVVAPASTLQLTRIAKHLADGGHDLDEAIEVFQTTALTVETDAPMRVFADGEAITETPVRFEIAPRQLRIAVPEASA